MNFGIKFGDLRFYINDILLELAVSLSITFSKHSRRLTA